jgi:prepilin-type N-terminal cleavage/methylation domain-containing protein/prepilin-type processing-associated H-X9-DG protein
MNRPASIAKKASGFTLIELLCVIAIIALMSSLIMPEIQSVRQKALCTACASNLRQIGIAENLYLADHDYTYPYIVSSTSANIPNPYDNQPEIVAQTFLQAFQAYGVTDKVLQCPADMMLGPNSSYTNVSGSTSYMWYPVVDGDPAGAPTVARRLGLRQANLSKTRQASDFTAVHKFTAGDAGSTNSLYLDGHVSTK